MIRASLEKIDLFINNFEVRNPGRISDISARVAARREILIRLRPLRPLRTITRRAARLDATPAVEKPYLETVTRKRLEFDKTTPPQSRLRRFRS
jgi:hypothetical protein